MKKIWKITVTINVTTATEYAPTMLSSNNGHDKSEQLESHSLARGKNPVV
jgi:hypothetical protein